MASLSENLSYIRTDMVRDLARLRAEAAKMFERLMVEQIESGEGQHPYSGYPTWYNTQRIPRFRATLEAYAQMVSATVRRDVRGRFAARSRYGLNSVWMQRGYYEYRQAVGRPTRPVDFRLTGEFLNSLVGRSRAASGGGLHLWLGFRQQARSYGNLTNRELAEVIAERGTVDPFNPTVPGDSVVRHVLDRMFSLR